MLNIVPTNKYAMSELSPYNTKTCTTMWKLETKAKGNFVYVSLLKQQGNSEFEFISVSFFGCYSVIYVTNIQFR